MTYHPTQKILDKYADVLIKFSLNDGKGIKKGDKVLLQVPESAKLLLIALRKSVLTSGGHPIIRYLPDNIEKEFYDIANEEQIKFFPEKLMKGQVDEMDHLVSIIATTNKHELVDVDPKKILLKNESLKPYKDLKEEKENKGSFTWTLAIYATQAMATEVDMTLEDYWKEIIKACYLDEEEPIAKWKEVTIEINRIRDKLNDLKIQKLNVKSEKIDLTIGLGKNRKWMSCSRNNIPSFEIFISPDYRLTNGEIKFNKPLYISGNLIKDIELKFQDGKVISASASKGENLLKEMIAIKGANQIGEFSLTDSRFSKITKFMGDTLFDENVGGKFGNTHIALGSAYKDSFPGDPSSVAKEDWNKMGYNESSVHTDIISTENREVVATLGDGSKKLIYKDGQFQI